MVTNSRTKRGAASYYAVIVCAILFSVIVTGFIALMISEVKKSTERTLSQSAYDAAIAGIEDAKILMMLANDAKNNGGDENDPLIKAATQKPVDPTDPTKTLPCNDIGSVLGRTLVDGGYLVKEEGANDDKITQSYVCVDIDPNPPDYLASLSSANPIRLIPLQSRDNNSIKSIRISWYSIDNLGNQNTNFYNDIQTDTIASTSEDKGEGNIILSDSSSTPPIIVAQIYQASTLNTSDPTKSGFQFDEFKDTVGSTTNRGTLWLVPSGLSETDFEDRLEHIDNALGKTGSDFYKSTYYAAYGVKGYDAEVKRSAILTSNALLNSNDHVDSTRHDSFPVRCANASDARSNNLDYLCSVIINLPRPKDGNRSDEQGFFLLALSMPYGSPKTDFRVQMSAHEYNGTENGSYNAEDFNNVQIIVDSTGRANDVYSRVAGRVEFFDSSFPFPQYAVTLGNGDAEGALWKDFWVNQSSSNCLYTAPASGSPFQILSCDN